MVNNVVADEEQIDKLAVAVAVTLDAVLGDVAIVSAASCEVDVRFHQMLTEKNYVDMEV